MLVTTSLGRKKITQIAVLNRLSALARMDAETFCERWFEIDRLEPEQKEQMKQERGYRAKCVRILSAVLRKPQKTVGNWGSRFEAMPEDYQMTLAYADALRLHFQAAPEELLELLLEQRFKQS